MRDGHGLAAEDIGREPRELPVDEELVAPLAGVVADGDVLVVRGHGFTSASPSCPTLRRRSPRSRSGWVSSHRAPGCSMSPETNTGAAASSIAEPCSVSPA